MYKHTPQPRYGDSEAYRIDYSGGTLGDPYTASITLKATGIKEAIDRFLDGLSKDEDVLIDNISRVDDNSFENWDSMRQRRTAS